MVPGCPEPTLNQALVDAAVVFCEDTLVVRERLQMFNTVVGQTTYDLDVPSATEDVTRILHVVADGRLLDLMPQERAVYADSRQGYPAVAYSIRNESEFLLALYPTPDEVMPVDVTVALRPKRNATTLNDDLYHLWVDTVVHGTLARLCAIQGQPFTNEPLAQSSAVMFQRGINRARIEGSYGRVRGQIRVGQRPFA